MSEKCKQICMVDKCRICLSDSNSMIDIFIPEIFTKIKEFAASISITIDHDNNLPKNICHICLYKLEVWDEFKQQLKNSNELLVKLLNSHELSYNQTKKVNDNGNNDLQLTQVSSEIDSHHLKAISTEVTNSKTNTNEVQSLFLLKTKKNKAENSSEDKQTIPPLIRTRLSGIRRTNEQRMASTQRWVARKRALLAATGENDSDTDSINSDATLKLSSLKRHRKSFNLATNENHQLEPQSLQSEFVMDNAMFIVTSTLYLSESSNINQLSNVAKLPLNHDRCVVTHEQQNIDIMNALQLCRINSTNKCLMDDGKFVERCLNMEIEGTKFETLQNLQLNLASFIEKDIKKRISNENNCFKDIDKKDVDSNEPFQTLEQQLKVTVEKAIKKNLNRSKDKQHSTRRKVDKFYHKKTFSNAFIKAAMKSQIFQPRVILNRLDSKLKDIENDKDLHKSIKQSSTSINYHEKQAYTANDSNYHNHINNIDILKKLEEKDTLADVNNDSLNENKHEQNCNFSKKEQMQSEKIEKKRGSCKKCHQIVEDDFVKTHVCESSLSECHHKCDECNVIFFTESLLLNHKKIHQSDQKILKASTDRIENSYLCFICDKKFTNDEILKEHLQKHCDDSNEKEHHSISKSTKKYHCAICGHSLSTEKELERHVEEHLFDDNPNHDNIIQSSNIKKPPGIQFEAKLPCLQDNKKLDTNIESHTQGHGAKFAIIECHQDDYQMENGCRSCTICELTFKNEQELLDHVNIHNNASCVCMLCDQPFLSLAELQEHVNSH